MQKEYSSYLLNKSVENQEDESDVEKDYEILSENQTKRLTSHLYSRSEIKAKRDDDISEEEEDECFNTDSINNSVFAQNDPKNKVKRNIVKAELGLDFSGEIHSNNNKVDSFIKNLSNAMSNRRDSEFSINNRIEESRTVKFNLIYFIMWKLIIFLRKTNFQVICSKNKHLFILLILILVTIIK